MVTSVLVVGVGVVVLVAFSLYQWHVWHKRQGSGNQAEEFSERAALLEKELPPVVADAAEEEGAEPETPPLPQADESPPSGAGPPTEPLAPTGGQVRELLLEVISGPSVGKRVVRRSEPPLAASIGRAPQSDLPLQDPEVSSLHAVVEWSPKRRKWQVTDKSSLNGTCVNGQSVGVPGNDTARVRLEGTAVDLQHGDVLTLGNSTKLRVCISTSPSAPATLQIAAPFEVAVAADPMTTRKGSRGKPLPMEDVSFCEWPLQGVQEFGLVCIFDGHAGRAAADNVSRLLPQHVSRLLQQPSKRAAVLRNSDASAVLHEAFRATEAELPNEDEGCTATALLLWRNNDGSLSAQAANVGDSHCVLRLEGEVLQLTEDHRLTGPVERARLAACGYPLREGETRLCGMNIARVLGDKFLKAQNIGLSAEPYISQVVRIVPRSSCIAVIASDGLWDVISPKRSVQLALEARSTLEEARRAGRFGDAAQAIANHLLARARLAKTVDNTTVIALAFEANHGATFPTLKQAPR